MVHIGIIPDGNRRWCKKNNYDVNQLPILWKDYIIKIIKEFAKIDDINKYTDFENVNELSIYIASIDNTNRNDKTKLILFKLFEELENIINYPEKFFDKSIIDAIDRYSKDIKINFIGDINILPKEIQKTINKYKKLLTGNKYIINLAIAYDYNKDIINEGKYDNLNYNRDQTNIDIVFRSGKEKRLSGFFPTKTIYSELFFSDKLWLDIEINDIYNVLLEYKERDRRFGK
tara:strand:- start:705 stop:1397 length:693 start_codon:yes stop_codon:yes gene_type:complete